MDIKSEVTYQTGRHQLKYTPATMALSGQLLVVKDKEGRELLNAALQDITQVKIRGTRMRITIKSFSHRINFMTASDLAELAYTDFYFTTKAMRLEKNRRPIVEEWAQVMREHGVSISDRRHYTHPIYSIIDIALKVAIGIVIAWFLLQIIR